MPAKKTNNKPVDEGRRKFIKYALGTAVGLALGFTAWKLAIDEKPSEYSLQTDFYKIASTSQISVRQLWVFSPTYCRTHLLTFMSNQEI